MHAVICVFIIIFVVNSILILFKGELGSEWVVSSKFTFDEDLIQQLHIAPTS